MSDALDWWEAVLLGVIEGLTEFLPVSSTGHLTVTEKLLGHEIDAPDITAFTAIIQIGAILAAVIYFRADIRRMIVALAGGIADRERRGRPGLAARDRGRRRVDPDRHRRPRLQGPDRDDPARPLVRRRRADPLERRHALRRHPRDPGARRGRR